MMSRMSLAPEPSAAAGGYSFPTLKGKQILECLQDLQIPISEEVSCRIYKLLALLMPSLQLS
jgi:hypothetical protein